MPPRLTTVGREIDIREFAARRGPEIPVTTPGHVNHPLSLSGPR